MLDGETFGREVADMVRGFVATAHAPLLDRIDALERELAVERAAPRLTLADVTGEVEKAGVRVSEQVAEAVAALPPAINGKDADMTEVREFIRSEIEALKPTDNDLALVVSDAVKLAVAALPAAKDGDPGKDADPEATKRLVDEAVAAAVEAIPAPQDGRSVTVDDVQPLIDDAVKAAVEALPSAQNGKDADPEAMQAAVSKAVAEAVAALPRPEDGKSVSVDDIRPVLSELVTEAVKSLPAAKDGRDGVGLAGAIIDREGGLILTLSDGATRDLGRVVGEQGERGFDLDAFDVNLDPDGRTVELSFDGKERRETYQIQFPIVIDRGTYKEGQNYERGDGVTWGGSYWIAKEETTEKPDSGKGWRLAVKKGRDGRDADRPAKAFLEPAK